jgi:hypothetical protein
MSTVMAFEVDAHAVRELSWPAGACVRRWVKGLRVAALPTPFTTGIPHGGNLQAARRSAVKEKQAR